MSRFLRSAGSSGGGATYGDSNVCTLLPSYTGTLTAGDGTNICCIRTDWELICECNGIDECYGTCLEFTFPSTADADNCKFTAYKLEVNGLYGQATAAMNLSMKIGNKDCYCTCCSGFYKYEGDPAPTSLGFTQALCFHCIKVTGTACWQGGNYVGCFARFPFLPACNPSAGFGVCFSTCTWSVCQEIHTNGWENCLCRTCWEEFCKVALDYGGSCIICHCGSFRIYGKRLRSSAYSGYTQS